MLITTSPASGEIIFSTDTSSSASIRTHARSSLGSACWVCMRWQIENQGKAVPITAVHFLKPCSKNETAAARLVRGISTTSTNLRRHLTGRSGLLGIVPLEFARSATTSCRCRSARLTGLRGEHGELPVLFHRRAVVMFISFSSRAVRQAGWTSYRAGQARCHGTDRRSGWRPWLLLSVRPAWRT